MLLQPFFHDLGLTTETGLVGLQKSTGRNHSTYSPRTNMGKKGECVASIGVLRETTHHMGCGKEPRGYQLDGSGQRKLLTDQTVLPARPD